MNKRKFVFIGDIVNQKDFDIYSKVSKNTTNYAAFKYFNRLIRSIENRGNLDFTVLSVPFLGQYKKDTLLKKSDCFTDSFHWKYECSSTKRYKRLLDCNKAFKKNEKKILTNSLDETSCIFVTQPNVFYLKSALRLKRENKNKPKIVLFVPDLTEFSNFENKSILISILKKIETKYVNRVIKKIDGFVLFSQYMAEKLNIQKKSIVLETISEKPLINNEPRISMHGVKTILYAGTINHKFGIKDFCNSFSKIAAKTGNVKLLIAGSGDLSDYFKTINNQYIEYLGSLTHDEVLKIQKECDVVVNPRPNSGEYVRYSFPSKITEYLLYNGTVACFKLDGIPDEYDSVLNYPRDNSFDSLAALCVQLAFSSFEQKRYVQNRANELLKSKTGDSALNKLINYLEVL